MDNAVATRDVIEKSIATNDVFSTMSDDLTTLLARVQLRYMHRSARKLWIGRRTLRATFALTLTHVRIDMHNDDNTNSATKLRLRHELTWDDVLGAHIRTADGNDVDTQAVTDTKSSIANNPSAATKTTASHYVLCVVACPSNHKPQTTTTTNASQPPPKHKRRLLELHFELDASQLRDVLALRQWLVFLADPRTAAQRHAASNVAALVPQALPPRRFLVLINPVGGAGNGRAVYATQAAPLFAAAGINVQVEITTHAGHATAIVHTLPLDVYDCVISVGGDGSLSEITQGLMTRADWNYAIRQPLGILPSGSGNGLAHSILHQSHECPTALNAAFVLAKGTAQDLDLATIQSTTSDTSAPQETMYAFLSLEWAAIADVDLMSEKLRYLGGLRFAVGFLYHILWRTKTYQGTLSYLVDDDGGGETVETTGPSRYFATHDPDATALPGLDLLDARSSTTGSKTTWRTVTGDFHLLWAMSITHAASDALVAPAAALDDGFHYILVVDGTQCRRTELIPLLLAMEKGKHVARKSVQLIRTRAYTLAPVRTDDAMCVDGELIPGPALVCQVHRGLGRVVTLPRVVVE